MRTFTTKKKPQDILQEVRNHADKKFRYIKRKQEEEARRYLAEQVSKIKRGDDASTE